MKQNAAKRYMDFALVYTVVAMVFGVFYREFTKFSGFIGKTNLSIMHTHYFLLGMVVFVMLALAERIFRFSQHKQTGKVVLAYNIGLNITGLGFLVRGLVQVLGTSLAKGANAALSGVAGIGHIILSVSLVMLLLLVRRRAGETE